MDGIAEEGKEMGGNWNITNSRHFIRRERGRNSWKKERRKKKKKRKRYGKRSMKFLPRYILILLRFFAVYTYTLLPPPIISIWSSTVPFHVSPCCSNSTGISISNEEILKTLAQRTLKLVLLWRTREARRVFAERGNFWLGRKTGEGWWRKRERREKKMGKEKGGEKRDGRSR